MKIFKKISILFLIHFVVVYVNGDKDKWVWSRSNNRPSSSQSLPSFPPSSSSSSSQSQSRPSSFYQRLENDYENEYRRYQQFSYNNFINNGNRENFQSSQINPSINNGFIDSRPPLLPQYQQPPPLPFSSQFQSSNFHHNNNQQNHLNGILVGPEGPTGIIGRPSSSSSSSSNNHVIGNSENGILIGPGGPTGIIGRPSYLQGFSSNCNCREPIKYPSSSNNLGPIYPPYPQYPPYSYSGRSASEKKQ